MDGPNKTAEEIMGEIQDLRQIIADFEAQDTALEDLKEQLQQETEDHKRAREEISEERNKLQSILGAMQSGVTIRDLDYTLTYQNELVTKIYGDRTGQKCYRVFEGRDDICEGCPVELAFKDGQSHTSIRQRVLPSGDTTYWENTANPIKDANGKIVSCLEVNINITEQKKAEEVLRESESELKAIHENAPLNMLLVDRERRVIKMNAQALSMARRSMEESVGLRAGEALRCVRASDDPKGCGFGPACEDCGVRKSVLRAFESGKALHRVEASIPYDHPDGPVDVHILVSAIPLTELEEDIVLVCLEDITDRKQAETALQESQERFNLAVEGSNDGMWDWPDVNSEKEWWSSQWYELLGYEDGEIEATYSNFKSFLHPDDLHRTEEAVLSHFERRVPFDLEYRLRTKSGEYRWFRARAQALWDADGRPYRMSGSIRDITERKQAKETLRKSEEHFRLLYERSPLGYQSLDADGNIIEVNPAWLSMLGYDKEEVIGRPFADFLASGFPELFKERFPCFKASREIHSLPFVMITADGSHIDVEVDGKIGYNPNGSFKQTHCILHDVTERKRAEEAIRLSEQRLSLIYDSVVDALYYIRVESEDCFRFLSINQAFLDATSLTKEQIIGKRIEEVIPEPSVWMVRDNYKKAIEENQIVRWEETSVYPAGKKSGEASIAPVLNENGVCTHLVGAVHDITERKQAEEQLETARHKAEAANIAKSQFLANMSHEIRTPMNVITGFAGLLSSEEDPGEQKIYVDLIQKAGKSLLRIIDEILDVSRIEAGKLEIKIEDCSLDKLVSGIEVMMQPLAREEGLQFDVFRCGKLPDTIQTDSGRVRQCLINLIGNAIKFTKRGYVHLKVSADYMQNKPFLRFDVEDTGIGIPQDKHVAVFETFSQADGSHTRQYGGTGLGLTITKQLARLLGGDLSFTSAEGAGSVFSLLIPAGVDAEPSALSGEGDQTKDAAAKSVITDNLDFSGKVLLAEDKEGCKVLAQRILKRYGLEVVTVEDGEEAIEKARIEQFDLILMDIQMPGLNGLEATKKLREEGITTPIVALTAYAMPEDRANCMAAGCDDYISKPIDQDELRRVLSKYVPAGEASP